MKRVIVVCIIFLSNSLYTVSFRSYTTVSERCGRHTPSIAIVGTGYVGLVTGTGLAELGNNVVCVDIDQDKIALLNQNISPIYEPGLEEMMKRNTEQHRLSFTTNIEKAIHDASIIFIAVGTPMSDDGSADLTALFNVIKTIAHVIDSHKIIVTKSTVPVGTGSRIRTMLEEDLNIDGSLFDLVSNPEFLREGSAIKDFLEPDRIVIGIESAQAGEKMCAIYKTLLSHGVPYVVTNLPTAEIIKYASNAFLAIKLSFINEIANLCDATGGNVQTVALAMGLDHRISPAFLQPGPGYGGSCFPKDSQALVHMAEQYHVAMNTVQGAIQTNDMQQYIPVQKLTALMKNSLRNKTVAVLGLAFKANTDDIRYSPSITAINQLLELGVCIKTYDPQAMKNMKKIFPTIVYCDSAEDAIKDADALIIMTEWEEFKHLNIERMSQLMRDHYIVDARNLLDINMLRSYGFICDAIGQGLMACPEC